MGISMKGMKDNKGFSLVELVIILAIMAVLGGVMFYSYTLLTGQYARELANNLSVALDKEGNYAHTKSATVDCYMELVKEDDGYYARYYVPKSATATGYEDDHTTLKPDDWVLAEEQNLGKERVEVKVELCKYVAGTTVTEPSYSIENPGSGSGQSLKFVYNRTGGAIKGVLKSDGTTRGVDVSSIELQCTKITILYGRKYEIEIYPATGKHVLSRVS